MILYSDMVSNNHDIPVLIGHEGNLDGQRWMLREDIILGRDHDCGITIQNRQVSRHHARISLTPNGALLEDLNSKNGTHCNGERLTVPTPLVDGDVIYIALAQKFVYLSSDATLPIELEAPLHPAENVKLRIEKRSRRVWINNIELLPPLSASQYKLLEILYEENGNVVSREILMATVWGDDSVMDITNQALDALVRRLRGRLAEIDSVHTYIATVRGHGLRIDNPSQE
ncbi:MAG: FHA domain-containing protein [Chloroflexi bacterium]|nr:FHA domain-containing protein [Chloroflexota bacterium]